MKRFKLTAPLMLALVAALALSITTATAMGASHKKHADKLTIGFVTHAVGDPFIKQILQAAKDAGKDLGVNVKTTGTPAFDPAAQLKMVQDLFASGADGVATSITGDSMATGLNALVAQGKPIVEFNIYSTRVKAPYVGERSVGDWAMLGKAVRTKMGCGRERRDRRDRHLRSGLPGARRPHQRRQEGPRRGRQDQGPVRRDGRPDQELHRVAAADRRQPGREGADRRLRAGSRDPRQAEQGQEVHHRRRRPDARQPRRALERRRA